MRTKDEINLTNVIEHLLEQISMDAENLACHEDFREEARAKCMIAWACGASGINPYKFGLMDSFQADPED